MAVTLVTMLFGLVTWPETGLKVRPTPLNVNVAWVPDCRFAIVLLAPLRRVGVLTGMVMPDGTTAIRVGATWTLLLKLTKKVWDMFVKGTVTVQGPVPLTYVVLLVTLTPFLVTLESV